MLVVAVRTFFEMKRIVRSFVNGWVWHGVGVMAVQLTVQELTALFEPRATREACISLAYVLARVSGSEEERRLVESLTGTKVIERAVSFALSPDVDTPVMHSVLSALVNLAAIGGMTLVKSSSGFELFCEQLSSAKKSHVYYSAAGVQNMMRDRECLQKAVDSGIDFVLEKLLDAVDPEIARFAAGALANIYELQTHLAAVAEPSSSSSTPRGSPKLTRRAAPRSAPLHAHAPHRCALLTAGS